jgi:hypothetical protein
MFRFDARITHLGRLVLPPKRSHEDKEGTLRRKDKSQDLLEVDKDE